jgi:hypothetical protein
MFIIPFYRALDNVQLRIIWIFATNNGKSIWKTDEKKPTVNYVIKEYLEPNGFIGNYKLIENTLFVEMNRIDFNEYYKYTDSLPEGVKEVWKPFFLSPEADWEEEADKISLGDFGSVKHLWYLFEKLRS